MTKKRDKVMAHHKKAIGTVYLTGAGPGDIELLTVKALRVIRRADVIVYDRLVNPEILREAKEGCELIYVGKADGKHTLPQEEINALLYEKALECETVVRLKGGDPTVFGRGGEEALFLREKGVPFVFIPGVTSAVAVPESVGIPVTHRGVADAFCVVTGHSAKGASRPIAWERYTGDATVVFLMGLHNLTTIVTNLTAAGRPHDTPAAVISKGTMADARTVVGTLDDIVEKSQGLPTPALIIVGEVVRMHRVLGNESDVL